MSVTNDGPKLVPFNKGHRWQKGHQRFAGAGRKRGTPNKLTVEVRQAIAAAFHGIGGLPAFIRWCRQNRSSYYNNLLPRLLPTNFNIEQHATVTYRSIEEVERAIAASPLPMRALERVLLELERGDHDAPLIELGEASTEDEPP